jgi:HAMP domain-containing protein
MSGPRLLGIATLLFTVLLATSSAGAEIARDIERKTEDLRASATASDAATRDKVAALEEAIRRGERASAGLMTQIKTLEDQKAALEDEKRALEKVQVVLTSGLIGALVTALVAILGTFLNFSRGRAERDLKRLEVLEKSVELEAKGIHVPDDIDAAYQVRRSPA